jgi:SulP family sulfate permease
VYLLKGEAYSQMRMDGRQEMLQCDVSDLYCNHYHFRFPHDMKLPRLENPAGDFWGGLAAMLVALPSAIAFGVTIYAVLGSAYVALGALAGILGATAIGIVASSFGGTSRLISAPCAPAAAVVSAFAIEAQMSGTPVDTTLLLLTLLGLLAGLMQVLFGVLRLGRLIKYMPYTVVSGYLSGVGLIIIGSQVPKLLGSPKGLSFWAALGAPEQWRWQGILVGLVTIAVMVGAPRVIKAVPAAILGLGAGVAAYFGLALLDPALFSLHGNTLVVGALGGSDGGEGSFFAGLAGRWSALAGVSLQQLQMLFIPALTLAVLLSIDTLKTCVVLDALTRSRHDSNRELIGQGLGNLASGAIGGIPGAGTMGATLVNISGGASSRFSGLIEGVLALTAFLLLASLIAWVPVAALAGHPDRDRRAHDRPQQPALPQVALDHPRFRGDRRGDRHGPDRQPDRGLGRRHRAGRGAVHPRADRRLHHPPQTAGQRDLLQAHSHP